MLARLVAVGAFALTFAVTDAALAEPSPTPAPRTTPAARAQQGDATAAFLAWTQRVMQVLERANQTMLPFLQNDYAFDENDADAALAMLRGLSRQAAAARIELATASAELSAMAPFAHARATPEMTEISTVLLRDSRVSVENLENLLGDIIALTAAIERGDEGEIDRITLRLDRGLVVLIETQATMLRGRQQLVSPLTSSYYAVGGMAAMYDGMAALMASDDTFDVARLDAAVAAMDAAIDAQRSAITLERAAINASPSDPNHAVGLQIMEARTQFMRVTERARDEVRAAAEEGRAGRSNEDNRTEHVRVLGQLEYEYQAISRRQIELAAQLRL